MALFILWLAASLPIAIVTGGLLAGTTSGPLR